MTSSGLRSRTPDYTSDHNLGASTVRRVLGLAWLVGAVLFAIVAAQSRVPAGYLTRDPSTTAEEGWYLGLTSSLGIVGWAVATAVFGFGALIAHLARDHLDRRRVLLGGAGMTAVLLVDDLFLVHDDILLRVLGSEKPTLAAYAVLFLVWLVSARSHVSPTASIPLFAAMIAFATSVVVDRVWASDDTARLVVEDGAKFIGILSWVLFTAVFTLDALREPMNRAEGAT